MLNEVCSRLIDNLPNRIINNTDKSPIEIDLILSGGGFAGSYCGGVLMYLKEMERRNYIKVRRISGCSIGSFLGLLYFADSLNFIYDNYDIIFESFKTNQNLSVIKSFESMLKDKIPKDICKIVKNRLFICYNHVNKRKKYVRCKYKNTEQLFDTITKSCFLPYLIDGNMTYKGKYIDGFTPYFFKNTNPTKHLNKNRENNNTESSNFIDYVYKVFHLNTVVTNIDNLENINNISISNTTDNPTGQPNISNISNISNNKRTTLFINVLTYKKLKDKFKIENEKTNLHRILEGILEINTFFIEETDTDICITVKNNFNININYLFHYFFIYLIEVITIYKIYLLLLLQNNSLYQIV